MSKLDHSVFIALNITRTPNIIQIRNAESGVSLSFDEARGIRDALNEYLSAGENAINSNHSEELFNFLKSPTPPLRSMLDEGQQ